MKTIKELELKEEKQRFRLRQTQNELERIKEKLLLPDQKKKYEGKYFKYVNSAGSNYPDWLVYSFCISITRVNRAKANRFEVDYEGECTFSTSDDIGLYLFETEITGLEYLKALTKFKIKLDKLLSH